MDGGWTLKAPPTGKESHCEPENLTAEPPAASLNASGEPRGEAAPKGPNGHLHTGGRLHTAAPSPGRGQGPGARSGQACERNPRRGRPEGPRTDTGVGGILAESRLSGDGQFTCTQNPEGRFVFKDEDSEFCLKRP